MIYIYMQISFKFLDKIQWSIYGTICTLIPLILLLLFNQPLNIQTLVFSSLIGMLNGDIIPRIIFILFLCILIYKNNNDWILQSIIFIVSSIITYYIPFKVHKYISNNYILRFIFQIIIGIWMFYILYLILKNYLNFI